MTVFINTFLLRITGGRDIALEAGPASVQYHRPAGRARPPGRGGAKVGESATIMALMLPERTRTHTLGRGGSPDRDSTVQPGRICLVTTAPPGRCGGQDVGCVHRLPAAMSAALIKNATAQPGSGVGTPTTSLPARATDLVSCQVVARVTLFRLRGRRRALSNSGSICASPKTGCIFLYGALLYDQVEHPDHPGGPGGAPRRSRTKGHSRGCLLRRPQRAHTFVRKSPSHVEPRQEQPRNSPVRACTASPSEPMIFAAGVARAVE